MQIAYKVTFRVDGIDVTQIIEADGEAALSVSKPPVSQKPLEVASSAFLPGQSAALTQKGSGFIDPPGPGGGGGTPTIVISCPIIITRDNATGAQAAGDR